MRKKMLRSAMLILMTEGQIGEIEGYGRRLQRVFLRCHGIFISE
jgi:hypothetical protein